MKKITVGVLLIGLALVSVTSMVFHNRTTNQTYKTQESIETLIIDDSDTPVTVKGTNGTTTTVHYKESRKSKYRVKEDGSELRVERKYNWLLLSWLNYGYDQGEVVVEVPKEQLEELTLETSNAKVEIQDLSLDYADIETSNSGIELADLVVADTLDAETSNGGITMKDLAFGDGEFITSNSRIKADRIKADNVLLQTSNGNLKFDNVEVKQSLSAGSSNSAIEGHIIGKQSDFEIHSETSNGKNIPGNSEKTGDKTLDVETSNGDITITFSE